jgi:hypothetical protein
MNIRKRFGFPPNPNPLKRKDPPKAKKIKPMPINKSIPNLNLGKKRGKNEI